MATQREVSGALARNRPRATAASARPTMAALEAQVARLLSVFDSVPVAAVEFDADMRLVRYNAAASEIWGGDRPGYRLGTRNPWVLDAAKDAIAKGEAAAHFADFKTADGKIKHLVLTYLPDLDVSGRARRLFIEAVDVTGVEPEAGELYRPQFEAAFRQLLGGVVVAKAPDLAVLYMNARAHEILGAEIGYALRPEGTATDSGRHDGLVAVLADSLDGSVVRGREIVLGDGVGTAPQAVASAAPLFDSGGEVVAVLGVVVEVTARSRAATWAARSATILAQCEDEDPECVESMVREGVREGVRRDRALLSDVISNLGLGVLVASPEGTITETNLTAETMLGFEPGGELAGASYADLVYLDDAETEAELLAALADGSIEGYEQEQRLIRRDGSVVWVLVRAALLPPQERTKAAAVLRLVEDLTEQKDISRELQEAQDSVKRAYTDVIAAVTGDRLLLLTEREVEQRLGRTAQTRMRIASPIQLAEARARTRATLETEFPAFGEPDALLLACAEALTNALKHAGGGELEVRRVGNRVQCVVRDQGPGIDFASLPKATLVHGYSTMASSLGAGFTIMLEVCDSVLMSTGPHGTTIVLQMDASATPYD